MPNYRSPGVYIQELPSGSRPIEGVGTSTCAFVGITAEGEFNKPTKVTSWPEYVRTFGEWVEGAYLPHAVYQYFNNLGGACYVVRVGDDTAEPSRARAELTSAVQAGKAVYGIEAKATGPDGDGIEVTVEPQSSSADEEGAGEGRAQQADEVTVTVRQGDRTERFEGIGPRKGSSDLVSQLSSSVLVQAVELGSAPVAERVPASGTVTLVGGTSLPPNLSPDDFIGDPAAHTGIASLTSYDDVTMLVVPDIMALYERGLIDLDGVQAVQDAMVSHCEMMRYRMAILDSPRGMDAQQVKEWLQDKARFTSKLAALYYPWVYFWDPVSSAPKLLPPSAAVAGIWGRNDDTNGVQKAPANETVAGALDLELYVGQREQEDLNPAGINVIRPIAGRGLVVWGARTLSSDTSWRYINVRRLFNYIEHSLLAGTSWAVFENNDLDLWQRIKRTVSAFLLGLWRDGALFGATPEEAFYVVCDSRTTSPEDIANGIVRVEVGIAPVRPAEFVVFEIRQLMQSASA